MANKCPSCGVQLIGIKCVNQFCDDFQNDVVNLPSAGGTALPATKVAGQDRSRIYKVARYQHLVMISLLVLIGGNVMGLMAGQAPPSVAMYMGLGALATVLFAIVAVFLLASQVYNSAVVGFLCSIAMLIPCVSLIVLLTVNQAATGFLKKHGIAVGFMGADPTTLKELLP